jgi:hypothetical protein
MQAGGRQQCAAANSSKAVVLEGPDGHTHGGHGARLHDRCDGCYAIGQPVLALMTVEISTTHFFSLLLASLFSLLVLRSTQAVTRISDSSATSRPVPALDSYAFTIE